MRHRLGPVHRTLDGADVATAPTEAHYPLFLLVAKAASHDEESFRHPPLSIFLQNRQRAVPLDLPWLRRFAPLALEKCRGISGDGKFALKSIEEISVAIVSDRTMARLHVQFMGIPGPTDVLTFDHGEIVMSAQTAALYAAEHGHRIEEELALYTVHGLLHLNGFDDATSRNAAQMQKVQTRVLKECLTKIPSL